MGACWGPYWASAWFAGLVADTLRALATQEMAAHCEQIGQRAGHEEAMRVLLQSAIAHLGKAKHPLDDPDHMFNPGPHFGLGAVFHPLDLIDNTAVAVAAIGEIPGLGRALPDHRPLAAVSLITPYPGLIAVQQIGQHRAVGDIGRRRHRRVDQFGAAVDPKCAFIPKYHWLPFFVWCIAGSRALSAFLVEDGALMIVASTIVPVATFSPFAAKCCCTSSNSGRPRLCSSSR